MMDTVSMESSLRAPSPSCAVYERFALDALTEGPIRPGGLELTDYALSLCELPSEARLLDLGCGTGVTVEHLGSLGYLAAGIDPSPVMLRKTRDRNPSLPLLLASGEQLPFADASWDGVLLECSPSLSRNPTLTLKECRRVLKEGGKIILHDLYVRNPEAIQQLRALSFGSCVSGALSRDELLATIDACGLATLVWEDHTRALKQLLGQIIFSHGSVRGFWSSMGACTPQEGDHVASVLLSARLGYFLTIAAAVPQ